MNTRKTRNPSIVTELKTAVSSEPVKLREKKLKNGDRSLYLDIYWNGEREYDFLNLYLTGDRTRDKQTSQIAHQVKAQRILDLNSGKYKVNQPERHSESFLEYFHKLTKARYSSTGNYGNWDSVYKHLVAFAGGKDLTFDEADEKFLLRFKDYLQKGKLTKSKTNLSQNSCHSYYNKVRAALREAYTEKIIAENPATRVRGIKQGESKREFLDLAEIQKLSATSCDVPVLKRAFLFSVLTGLRWSDIMKMTWAEVRGNETEGPYLRFQQKKTTDYEMLPITKQAREILGEQGLPLERVFVGLRYDSYSHVALSRWILKAGITRHITFHCARHTHATLLLSQGVDIYVVSKLLGHKNIKTTEIYTKVSNIKKNEAIGKIPTLAVEW